MIQLILFRNQKQQEEFFGTEKEFILLEDFFCKVWRKNGLRHRVNGPAVIWKHGRCEYWLDGKLHRDGGPAVYGGLRGSAREWYNHGELFLKTYEDGVSVERYKNGKLHCDNGPSKVLSLDNREWAKSSENFRWAGKMKKNGNFIYSWHIEGDNLSYLDDWFPMLNIFGGPKG